MNKRWVADIGPSSFIFEVGKDYYESADVKRILFESGLLDPSCLVLDDEVGIGLNDQQLARIPEYSAAHAHCPSCGQMLNTQPTKADEEYDKIIGALT